MKRKHFFTENYFDNIDTPDKAYWLGLLLADGAIVKDCLKYKCKDKELLDKLQKSLNSDYPCWYDKITKEYMIQIYSKKLVSDLRKLGFIQKKFNRIRIPKIEIHLLSHFIRGYFDGDGCFYTQYNRDKSLYPRVEFYSCSEKFLKEMINKLKFACVQKSGLRQKKNTKCYVLTYNGTNALKLLNFIYKNSKCHLQRKINKYQNFLSLIQER